MKKILLAPDRLAHYRQPIFNKIASHYNLDIYAPKTVDKTAIKIAEDVDNKFKWIDTKSFFIHGIRFWHTKIISSAFIKKYDVYIFWGECWNISIWISALICRLLGKKVVFWTHGLYGNEGRLRLLYRTTFYRLANSILVYGSHSKKLLIEQGFDKKNIFVINNSLDFELQNSIFNKVSSKRKSHKYSIIFVGRLEPNKKIDFLLETISTLNDALPQEDQLTALIVGDGSQKDYLENLTTKLKLEGKVKFYGACYDQQTLAELITASDVCVSPGNVGLTAMQSLIYGTPVITHDNATFQMPEFEAVVEGQSGTLFKNGCHDSLSKAIIRCLNLIDRGVISAETCRNVIIQRYTPDAQLIIFNNMMKSLFNNIKLSINP